MSLLLPFRQSGNMQETERPFNKRGMARIQSPPRQPLHAEAQHIVVYERKYHQDEVRIIPS